MNFFSQTLLHNDPLEFCTVREERNERERLLLLSQFAGTEAHHDLHIK